MTTLDPALLETFREEGFAVVADVFTPVECERISTQIEDAAFALSLGDADDGTLTYRPMMHLASPALERAATDRRWADLVLPLVDDTDVRLYWEQAVEKPAQARTELPWHQDNGYTPLEPEAYLTCWLALDDADVHNGCLWVIPGSHRQGTVAHRNDDGGSPFRVGLDEPPEAGVPVPVARGSVLVFSSLLMHRSGPNVTDQRRLAWIIQFCGVNARSALSGRRLDDRLRCSVDGEWLAEPVREREIDLLAILGSYDQR